LFKAYLKYRIKRKDISFIDNPFIEALNEHTFSKIYLLDDAKINTYRNTLLSNDEFIVVNDLGAGSRTTKQNKRSVKSIFKNASISPKFGQLLNRLVSQNNCKNVLELGTSLGVGTSYLALNNANTQVFSIEGCDNISEFTQSHLTHFKNITFKVGEFSTVLNELKESNPQFELIYIDGNHTYEGTLAYYNWCLKFASKKAILVFDDIYWSAGMEKAWGEIIANAKSKVSLDMFRMGIVFLDPELDKKNYVIKF